MKKTIVMAKKGFANVELVSGTYSTGDKYYFAVVNGIKYTATADVLNSVYVQYKKNGWVVKPTENPKVAAPKKEKKPLKEYPDGFEWDKDLYYEVARTHRWSFCNQWGKTIVPRKYRDAIYAEMAEIQKSRRLAESVAITG